MKICFKCLVKKELSEFYRHSEMADGHLNKCKSCTKKDTRAVRERNPEYYREYDRSRSNLPHRISARLEYRKTSRGKWIISQLQQRWISRNPEKREAHLKVGNAIRNKKLIKQPCEVCGSLNVHAHHDDYSKPLDVRWLCPVHHHEHHKNSEVLQWKI